MDIGTIGPYKAVGRESPVTDGFEPAPRMFNQEVQLGTMQDRKFEPSGGFVNPFRRARRAQLVRTHNPVRFDEPKETEE